MISLSLLPAMVEVGGGRPSGSDALSPGGDPARGLYRVVDGIFDEDDVFRDGRFREVVGLVELVEDVMRRRLFSDLFRIRLETVNEGFEELIW
jgi:hypothetical protein